MHAGYMLLSKQKTELHLEKSSDLCIVILHKRYEQMCILIVMCKSELVCQLNGYDLLLN